MNSKERRKLYREQTRTFRAAIGRQVRHRVWGWIGEVLFVDVGFRKPGVGVTWHDRPDPPGSLTFHNPAYLEVLP